jgi:hypothetical protein
MLTSHVTSCNYRTFTFRNENATFRFRYYYRQIFGANTIIDILGGNDAVPTTGNKCITMGQAKAMSAYATST